MQKSTFFSLLLFYLILSSSIQAQTSFSASPEIVTAYKSANIFVFYGYTQFQNLTDDTLQMRWVKTTIENTQPIGGGGGGSSEYWDTAIQDPNNFYNPANKLDSAEFFLPPVTSSTDKFILQLFPNMAPGDLKVEFLFFPIDNPTDTLTVLYDYTAFDPTMTNIEDLKKVPSLEVFPNPATDFVILKNQFEEKVEVQLLNLGGKLLERFELTKKEEKQLNLSTWNRGIYFLKSEKEGKTEIKRLILE